MSFDLINDKISQNNIEFRNMVAPAIERIESYRIDEPSIKIGSLGETKDVLEAVGIVEEGGIVVAQVYGVFGIWGDGENSRVLEDMAQLKGDTDHAKPYSVMMFSRDIVPYIDKSRLHPSLSQILEDPDSLSAAVGTMVHLRLPLRPNMVYEVPERMRSIHDNTWVIHNLDPTGHPIANLIDALNQSNISFAAVTTLNAHGQPENTTLEEALETLADADPSAQKVTLILKDPMHDSDQVDHLVRGSLIVVDTLNARIIREGFIPVELANLLLQAQLDVEGAKAGHYQVDPQLQRLVEHARIYGYTPQLIRMLIHNYIKGSVVFS